MHGKPSSKVNYFVDEDDSGNVIRKILGGETFNYHTKEVEEGQMLDNEVEALTMDGYIKEQTLGLEYDLGIYSRRSHVNNASFSTQVNADIIPGPFFGAPFLIPSGSYKSIKDIQDSRIICLTKVIQTYGLLESVETFTDQYATTTYNRLYDAASGEVILTETSDEHNKNSYRFNVPAHTVFAQNQMGAAYKNTGYRTEINHEGELVTNTTNLNHGDEVLVFPPTGTPHKAWVEKKTIAETPPEVCQTKLLTAWYGAYGSACGNDNYRIDTNKLVKGRRGEILEEATIFPLKDTFNTILNQIEFDTLFKWRDGYNPFPGYTNLSGEYGWGANNERIDPNPSVAPYLFSNVIYKDEHLEFCNAFSFFNGDTTIFSSGKDLMFEIEDTSAYHISDLFNFKDSMTAKVEGVLSEIVTLEESNNTCSVFDTIYKHNRWTYNEDTDVCLSKLPPERFYYKGGQNIPVSDHQNYFHQITPVNLSRNFYTGYGKKLHEKEFKGIRWKNYNKINLNSHLTSWPDAHYNPWHRFGAKYWDRLDFHQKPNYVYAASRSMLKITSHDSIVLDSLANVPKLYLVRYKIQLSDGSTDYSYFIEKGNLYQDREFYDRYNRYCPQPQPVVETRLVDQAGNYLQFSNPEIYEMMIIKSGKQNQLLSSAGIILSVSYPIKVSQKGTYLGLKDSSDGLKILQASASNYTDSIPMVNQYQYPPSNSILKGENSIYRSKENLSYGASRFQKSSIESSKDGYMEDLPSLWKYDPCSSTFGALEASSGWQDEQTIEKYSADGQPLEVRNSLGLYSAIQIDYRGYTEAVASNCKLNRMAVDNFEHYEVLGTGGGSPLRNFTALNLSGHSQTSATLLNAGGEVYKLISRSNLDQLIKGVSHSGEYSMFLAGNNPTGVNSIDVTYAEKEINLLEQRELGQTTTPVNPLVTLDYTATKTAHFDSFTENLSNQLSTDISNATKTENTITIPNGSSNGIFKADSGKYWLSIWSKELLASGTPYAGESPEIEIHIISTVTSDTTSTLLKPSGPFIDGWQKIEGEFEVASSSDIVIIFKGGLWGTFYDDLRIHPYSSNLNTFVYDRYSGRLISKLDENNYATFYEYDEEGIPSQLKLETDQGRITISESRQSFNNHP